MMNTDFKTFESIEGKFDTYYNQYITSLKNKLNTLEVEELFHNQIEKNLCFHQLINGLLNELSEVTLYSLIDFYYYMREGDSELSYFDFNRKLKDQSTYR